MNYLKIISCVLVMVVAASGPLKSQYNAIPPTTGLPESMSLSLEQAVKLAIDNNPNLKRVQMGSVLLEKQVQRVKGTGLPQITGTTGFTDNFSLPQQILPGEIFGQSGQIAVTFGNRYGINAGVEVNQLIYSRAYSTNLKKLDASRTTVQLQYLATLEDLVYNVAQVYIQYQINAEQRSILEANIEQVNTLVNVAQAQFENGIVKKLDVDQIKVNRTNLLSELSNLEIGLEQQLNVLRFYLALDMSQPLELTEKLDEAQSYPLSDTLLMASNINYQLLQNQMALNIMDDDVINADRYPQISAFAQYGYTGQANEFNLKDGNYSGFRSGLWGINMSIPIFNGFQTKRQLEENYIKRQQLTLDIQQLENATKMEFRNAANNIQQSKKLVSTQSANMELAQEVYDITKLSYQEGVAPLTELLNAETGLRESQTHYLTALINLKLAELEYIKSSGQLAKLTNSLSNNQ
ncbi:MAG: TolC family protein [Lewinella sp.]|uniref:TolC family protein n=1 Tax=Lewinella sp. TaxID=2004506 RepID=UPI003D6A90C8